MYTALIIQGVMLNDDTHRLLFMLFYLMFMYVMLCVMMMIERRSSWAAPPELRRRHIEVRANDEMVRSKETVICRILLNSESNGSGLASPCV